MQHQLQAAYIKHTLVPIASKFASLITRKKLVQVLRLFHYIFMYTVRIMVNVAYRAGLVQASCFIVCNFVRMCNKYYLTFSIYMLYENQGKYTFQPYTSTMHYVSKILLFLIFTGVKTYKKRIGNGNFGDDAYCTHSADRAGQPRSV